jgi:hypothetical protein
VCLVGGGSVQPVTLARIEQIRYYRGIIPRNPPPFFFSPSVVWSPQHGITSRERFFKTKDPSSVAGAACHHA